MRDLLCVLLWPPLRRLSRRLLRTLLARTANHHCSTAERSAFCGICLHSSHKLSSLTRIDWRNVVNWPRLALPFLAAATFAFAAGSAPAQTTTQSSKKPAPNTPAGVAVPNAPQSTHYPILLLAFGSSPSWDVRIGPKGPELLQRQGYPPIVLEPAEISREGTTDTWIYHAKDTAGNAEVSVHLSREACTDTESSANTAGAANPANSASAKAGASSMPAIKNTFRAVVTHSQIGNLQGCARIAAELFPRMPNQSAQDDDEDTDKKKIPVVPPITNAKAPAAVAYVNATGKIVVSRNGIKKIAASTGSELSLAHDGKRLLFTRSDHGASPSNTIVLYDFDTGRSRDLVHGTVGSAFWSPDDSRIAYLNSVDQKSQVWFFSPDAPEKAAPFSAQNVVSLQGWVDAHTVFAIDAQNAYWLSEDRPAQTLVLREIYGEGFQMKSSDTLRVDPINSDLLLVSAAYTTPPTAATAGGAGGAGGAPVDSTGTAYGLFLYELHAKRRVTLSPLDQYARNGEWSRDGIQVFYTRRVSSAASAIFRIFWDGSGLRRYAEGSDLAIGQ
jgi:uncharacterized membrane protein